VGRFGSPKAPSAEAGEISKGFADEKPRGYFFRRRGNSVYGIEAGIFWSWANPALRSHFRGKFLLVHVDLLWLTHYLIFKLPKPEKKLSKDANLISKSGLRSSLKPDSKYIFDEYG
jgi:hypothetical protein